MAVAKFCLLIQPNISISLLPPLVSIWQDNEIRNRKNLTRSWQTQFYSIPNNQGYGTCSTVEVWQTNISWELSQKQRNGKADHFS